MAKDRRLFVSFYFDEDVSVIVAKIIRAHGFETVCASEIKELGRSDEEQLEYAVRNNYVLVTHNIRDFVRLHKEKLKENSHHSGIILAIRRRNNYEFARRLLELLQKIEPGDLDNQIRYI